MPRTRKTRMREVLMEARATMISSAMICTRAKVRSRRLLLARMLACSTYVDVPSSVMRIYGRDSEESIDGGFPV